MIRLVFLPFPFLLFACGATSSDLVSKDGNKLSVIARTFGYEKELEVKYNDDTCNGVYTQEASNTARENGTSVAILFNCSSGADHSGELFLYGYKAAELHLQISTDEEYKIPLVLGKQI
jgi:hypothetical protein